MDASPPRYRRFSRAGEVPPQPGAELPPYTRRRNTLAQPVSSPRPPTEHLHQLFDGKGMPWASLKVFSSAKSTKSLPTFFEKENLNGTLELDVGKGESIQAITATVTGRIITGAGSDDSYTFLNLTVPIWSKAPDAPRLPSTSPGANGSKLCGQCIWPISIVIPRTVNLPSGSGEQPYHLPETFLERHTGASIQYDLTILISRGKLRADNRIITAFGYVPATRPDPPSRLRQLAYEQNAPIPGPDVDPAGWKVLPPIPIRGHVFKTRRTEARCRIALANPLCYTRGTVVPCRMVLQGDDAQVLDLLSAPSSILLSLRRRLRFYNKSSSSKPDVAWNESLEDVGTAVWWPSTTDTNHSFTRYLEGEIRLAKDLKPTAAMGHFSISYDIVLSPFEAVGFAAADTKPVVVEKVEIATMRARGPRAQAYSPPAYEPIRRQNNEYTMPVLRGAPVVAR